MGLGYILCDSHEESMRRFCCFTVTLGCRETAQWLIALAVLLEDVGSIPSPDINHLTTVVLQFQGL